MKDTEVERLVVVNLTIQGTHRWETCNIKEVLYLKEKHRHLFYIETHKKVTHNNRQVEIIMLKNKLIDYLTQKYKGDFGNMSCEDIAEELLVEFNLSYVKVLEDNENGAIVKL
jgi:hypothetical protein